MDIGNVLSRFDDAVHHLVSGAPLLTRLELAEGELLLVDLLTPGIPDDIRPRIVKLLEELRNKHSLSEDDQEKCARRILDISNELSMRVER